MANRRNVDVGCWVARLSVFGGLLLSLAAFPRALLSQPSLAETGRGDPPGLTLRIGSRDGIAELEYLYDGTAITRVDPADPVGVTLGLPGQAAIPLRFDAWRQDEGSQGQGETVGVNKDFGPLQVGALTLRWRIHRRTPELMERTLEVTASARQSFHVDFSVRPTQAGEYATFSGAVEQATEFDTVKGASRMETFPVAMVRNEAATRVLGLIADSPGRWENRCAGRLDPKSGTLAILAGDGRPSYPLVIRPPEDARDTYQYQMDGWQTLEAGESKSFTTWLFTSFAANHYDAQLAAHLALANGKGWGNSALEAILRNTSYLLLRRNLALDEHGQARNGKYIFISGPGYGWKQWVSDGFYTALGLDDPEATMEANRAVFWTRMDYEDNAHYYLIWGALVRRTGGEVDLPLLHRAHDFIRTHEENGAYLPPSLPGAPNSLGWKTYHDVLPYEEGDCPASDQGFHCGALIAARELGLPVGQADIDRAILAYRGLFNHQRGFMPTSRLQSEVLGQDTLYGATLTYAAFGEKLLTDEQVLLHVRTSERVKTPFGLRVISQADGSLLPGHSGVYCYGGSWFLNDAANYLLARIHGAPAAEIEPLLVERIQRELAQVPAFNESISTLDGHPHGHILYSWNSGYWWLRREIRRRLGEQGPDPVESEIDDWLGVVHDDGSARLVPRRGPGRSRSIAD